MHTQSSILFWSFMQFCIAQTSFAQWISTNGPYGVGIASFVGSQSNILAGTSNGVFRSGNADTAWTPAGMGGHFVRALTTEGTYLFAATPDGVFRSTDNGASWASGGLLGSSIFSLLVKDTTLLVGTTSGVFRSPMSDTMWSAIGPADALVYALLLEGNRLFAGTAQGVFLSTNDGTTWTGCNLGLTDSIIMRLSIGACGLLAGTYLGYVFASTDHGASWTTVGSVGSAIVGMVAAGNNIVVCSDWAGGVDLSSNCGTTWNTFGNGLPTEDVRALALIGTNLYAGTYALGVWRRSVPHLVNIKIDPDRLPRESALLQNYPNPFNPNTTLRFVIHKSGYVSLTVHDVLGRAVATLLNENMEQGAYEALFDAASLASGVYFCRLRTGCLVQTKAMILLK